MSSLWNRPMKTFVSFFLIPSLPCCFFFLFLYPFFPFILFHFSPSVSLFVLLNLCFSSSLFPFSFLFVFSSPSSFNCLFQSISQTYLSWGQHWFMRHYSNTGYFGLVWPCNVPQSLILVPSNTFLLSSRFLGKLILHWISISRNR